MISIIFHSSAVILTPFFCIQFPYVLSYLCFSYSIFSFGGRVLTTVVFSFIPDGSPGLNDVDKGILGFVDDSKGSLDNFMFNSHLFFIQVLVVGYILMYIYVHHKVDRTFCGFISDKMQIKQHLRTVYPYHLSGSMLNLLKARSVFLLPREYGSFPLLLYIFCEILFYHEVII